MMLGEERANLLLFGPISATEVEVEARLTARHLGDAAWAALPARTTAVLSLWIGLDALDLCGRFVAGRSGLGSACLRVDPRLPELPPVGGVDGALDALRCTVPCAVCGRGLARLAATTATTTCSLAFGRIFGGG